MKPKVYITRIIPEEALNVIAEHCEYEVWPRETQAVPRPVLEEKIRAADGLYSMLTDRIDKPLLDMAPCLKAVSNMAVGFDNIDVDECTARGILVCNTPGVLTETTADLAWALLMAAARRITESERFLRENKWTTWSPMLLTGIDVYGATLGIVGFGRIGQAVARRAKGFGMRVLYYNRTAKPDLEASMGVQRATLDELLKASDFVSVHVPLTDETRGMIGPRELALMKPTAVLVNAARGQVVDEQALCRALKEKQIFAAGLDVFQEEPLPPDSPLRELDNVVLLPHIGSASVATRTKMAIMAARHLIQALRGERPEHIVNPEVLA
ncbi:MAG: 2-hydroxyacid dehydrogenase [Bacillota bacterium]|jgi:glyoxylate reductase|nr:D-glycerate dehydrogenase [Candidatus Fermentithermobacillaceae bacterium]